MSQGDEEDEVTARTRCPRCGRALAPESGKDSGGMCQACLLSPPPVDSRSGDPTPVPPQISLLREDSSSLAVGTTFKGFEIQELLGSGGMAVVYKVRQITLDRSAALKVLSPEYADSPKFIQRFEREGKILASLNHPNVVHVYEFGREKDLLFLAMEYVEGSTLQDRFDETNVPRISDFLELLGEVCDGLERVHGAGLVHRDIKPSNILLPREGGPKISDFGLAVEKEDSLRLTQTGSIIGTPHYMSPEQVLGKPIDGRSDLYSLGVILYQGVAGRLPFEGSSTAVLVKHVQEQPRPLREWVPELPPSLDALTLQLLSKNPDDRPPSARAVRESLKQAIRDVQAGEARGTLVRSSGPATRKARKFRRPIRALLVGGLLVVAALLALLPFLHRGSGEAPRPAAGPATGRLPEPGKAAQKEAEGKVRALFRAEYGQQSPDSLRQLGQKLLARGVSEKADPALQFVLLKEAQEQALRSGDLRTALAAVRETARVFETDEIAGTRSSLERIASSNAGDSAEIIDAFLSLAGRGIREDRYDVAALAAERALSIARTAKDSRRGVRSEELGAAIAELQKEYQRIKSRIQNPEQEGGEAAGRYFCFVKGDWTRGLPFLAGAVDVGIKGSARLEMANPADPGEQVRVGDGWWALAQSERNSWKKENLLLRAEYWYERAWPHVRGSTWTRIQDRLGQRDVFPEDGVDLLKLIDPVADALKSTWEFSQGSLVCRPDGVAASALRIPYRLPEEFDLFIVAERVAGISEMILGLPCASGQGLLILEGRKDLLRDGTSGLQFIDGVDCMDNATRCDGRIFESEKKGAILCSVRKDSIRITVDGRRIITWKGDLARLSIDVNDPFHPSSLREMTLGARASSFRFDKISLIPVSQGGGPVPPTLRVRRPAVDVPPLDQGGPVGEGPGLLYEYYEGSWELLPDFDTLAPKRRGITDHFEISQRKRDEFIGFRFKGLLQVPKDGAYTFFTNSDDASKLFIGDVEVVSNDGKHGAIEKSGTIFLKSGRHPIQVRYLQLSGLFGLDVSWEGPDLAKQIIPAGVLFQPPVHVDRPKGTAKPPDFSLRLGPQGMSSGMTVRSEADGLHEELLFQGKSCSKLVPNKPTDDARYLYFGLSGDWLDSWRPVEIVVEYFDDGGGRFGLQYDGSQGPWQVWEGSIGLTGTKTWKMATIRILDPVFRHRQHKGSDFRLTRVPGGDLWVHRVVLRTLDLPKGTDGGLNFEYYEGNWSTVPDFRGLKPVLTGVTALPDPSRKLRQTYFAMRFTGFIDIPKEGRYTFSTVSDDGSTLFIGSTQVVSNDGLHAPVEKSGVIDLKAGKHPFNVNFLQNHTGSHLEVYWEGPDLPRQLIPPEVFHLSSSPGTSARASGLVAHYLLNDPASPAKDSISGAGGLWRGDLRASADVPSLREAKAPLKGSAQFFRKEVPNCIDLPNSPDLDRLSERSFSISVWAKPLSLPPVQQFGIVTKRGEGVYFHPIYGFGLSHWVRRINKNPYVLTGGYGGDAKKLVGDWHHVVGVVDVALAEIRCYVDGVRSASPNPIDSDSVPHIDATKPWRIGITDPDPTTSFMCQMDGMIADVRFYNRALTSAEVARLYSGDE
jgi:predicted Ser/Thr protein kinase